jgi:hypothetical protein
MTSAGCRNRLIAGWRPASGLAARSYATGYLRSAGSGAHRTRAIVLKATSTSPLGCRNKGDKRTTRAKLLSLTNLVMSSAAPPF